MTALVILRGTKLAHSLSESALSAAIADVENARSATKALLQQIASEFKQSAPGLPAVQAFLNSADAKLYCALEVARKRPQRHRPPLEKILAIPGQLILDKPLPEKARLRVKVKKKGGLRYLFDFRMVRRTAQQMILRVLQQIIIPRPFQHAGLHHAISLAKTALSEDRHFYATLDIEDHNGSFSMKKLATLLPVPPEWVDYVVSGRHVVVKEKDMDVPALVSSPYHTLRLQAQRGLPCGSICSPIIAAYSVSFLPWETKEGSLLNYADNFLLLASSPSELENMMQELTAAVGKLPGGKFKLKLEKKGHANDGLDFLGHKLTVMANGAIRLTPNEFGLNSIYKLAEAAADGAAAALSCGDKEKAIKSCAPVKGWLASFAACDNMLEFQKSLIVLIAQNALLPVEVIRELMHLAEAEYDFANDEYQYI